MAWIAARQTCWRKCTANTIEESRKSLCWNAKLRSGKVNGG